MAKKEVVKTEEAPAVETAPAEAPQKKGSGLKTVGIVVGAIVFVGVLAGGYGLYNGNRVKTFAVESEKMYAVTNDWDKAFDEDDTDKIKDSVTAIKAESEKALLDLGKKSAPKKAKQLKSDLVEYFTISKKAATDAEAIVDWVAEIEKVTEDFSDMSALNTSTPEAMATSVDKAKTDIDASIVKMKSMDVPTSLKTQHAAFVKMLENMSAMYGRLSVALKANDLNALTSISNDFTTSMSALDSVESPEETMGKAWEEDGDRMEELDKSIESEITELKNVTFSF